MKKISFFTLLLLFVACDSAENKEKDIDLEDFKSKISYALGADMGANFANFPEGIFSQLDKGEIANGFHAILLEENPDTQDCLDVLRASVTHAGIDTVSHSVHEISNCYGMLFGEALRNSLSSKNGMKEVDLEMVRIGFLRALNSADTLINIEERQEMIIDFNNDLNKKESISFMEKITAEFSENLEEEGYVFIENKSGEGEKIDPNKEYVISFTFANTKGDTLYTTYQHADFSEEENSQVLTADIFPEVWRKATSKMEVGGEYTIYSNYELAYGEEGLLSPNSSNYIIQPYAAIVIHSQVFSQGEKYSNIKNKGNKIIAEAKKAPNTYVDTSGYILTTIEKGTGDFVPKGGDVQAHYVLTVSNGEEMDNSYRGVASGHPQTPTFSLNQVVKGWQYAIPKMREGGKYKLVLPYYLGYGERGNSRIQPYETLVFEIEIVRAGEAGTLTGNTVQQQLTEEQLQQLQQQLR